MQKIVICEDAPQQLAHIKQCVENYVLIEELDMKLVLATQQPKDVLTYYKENKKGETLYFLDIDLGEGQMTGMELAQEIRKNDDLSKIVFITTLSETMPLVFRYKLEALDFIVKDNFDHIAQQIRHCLDIASNRRTLNASEKKVYTAKIGRRVHVIDLADIYYFQSADNHKVILVGKDLYFEFYENLNNLMQQTNFTQVHRSFIANLDNVLKYDHPNKELFFNDGLSIPVGRTYQKNIQQLLQD